jgi:hypothetical protein
VAFTVYRDFDVGGIQPVPVKVYDYYEPDDSCTIFYNLGRNLKSMGKCRGKGICTCTQGIYNGPKKGKILHMVLHFYFTVLDLFTEYVGLYVVPFLGLG